MLLNMSNIFEFQSLNHSNKLLSLSIYCIELSKLISLISNIQSNLITHRKLYILYQKGKKTYAINSSSPNILQNIAQFQHKMSYTQEAIEGGWRRRCGSTRRRSTVFFLRGYTHKCRVVEYFNISCGKQKTIFSWVPLEEPVGQSVPN